MREIKFRYIYRRGNDIRAYVFRLDEIEYLDRFFDDIGLHFSSFSDFDKYMIKDGYKLIAKCQYTGLKDKNGKEVYEGDIVIASGSIWELQYSPPFCCYILRGGKHDSFIPQDEELEVIGNIYENPELLAGEKR